MTPAAAFRELLVALERLNIPYLISGSVASSVHGVARATRDIDVLVEMSASQVRPLASALARSFYADPDMMLESILARRAFNVIHYATSYKFDIFPAHSDAYTEAQFRRGQPGSFPVDNEEVHFQVVSAEDSILSKLVWYKSGGEISDQQWRDILGIVKVQGSRLDLEYLRKWALHLSVADLLDRALDS
jgi:hypothetical protein